MTFEVPLKTLILGGIKSGKTNHAIELVNRLNVTKKIYIATSIPFDEEMKIKIEKHKKERDASWLTLEEPLNIDSCIEKYKTQKNCALLIDCFTMWVNNMIYYRWNESKIFKSFEDTLNLIKKARSHVIGISNEVGLGVVPGNDLARKYVNILGEFNKKAVDVFSKVVFMVSGISLTLKSV